MPTGIDALCCDLAITVFLHELAVSHIVDIDAFKAVALLVLLDSWSVTLPVPEDALELRSVGKAGDTFSMGLTVQEIAFYGVTILLRQLAPTVLTVRLPLAYIGVTCSPYEGALAVLVTIEELP